MRILGHVGWILRSYLHDLCDHDIQAFITMMRIENQTFVVSLVWLFQCSKSSSYFLQLVANPSQWEWISEFQCLMFVILTMKSIICSNMKSIICLFNAKSIIAIFIRCTTSAPDGSSPRGYSRIFSSIGSKVLSSFIVTYTKQFEIPSLVDLYILSGARLALPMGVAPEAMVGFFEDDHRLKNSSTCICSIWLVCINPFISRCDIIDMTTYCVIWLEADRCTWVAW
jgi:hypothetical protein